MVSAYADWIEDKGGLPPAPPTEPEPEPEPEAPMDPPTDDGDEPPVEDAEPMATVDASCQSAGGDANPTTGWLLLLFGLGSLARLNRRQVQSPSLRR